MPLTLTLDSSQISSYLECPQKHDYEYAQNLVQLDPGSQTVPRISDKIAAGSLGHKYLEIYYSFLARISDPAIAARQALDFNPDSNLEEYPIDPTLRVKVLSRFRDYLVFYAGRDYTVACGSESRIEARAGILIDVVHPRPLIEQGFHYTLLDTPEYLFGLEGRIDFIGSANSELFFMDHKWQFREHELYAKSVQFRNYALVTGLPMGIVNYIRLHDKIGPKTFVRQPLCFSAADSAHWRAELIEIYIKIAKERASGTLFRNRFACAGRFGQNCSYIPLCDALSESERDFLVRQQFGRRAAWKPWERDL